MPPPTCVGAGEGWTDGIFAQDRIRPPVLALRGPIPTDKLPDGFGIGTSSDLRPWPRTLGTNVPRSENAARAPKGKATGSPFGAPRPELRATAGENSGL